MGWATKESEFESRRGQEKSLGLLERTDASPDFLRQVCFLDWATFHVSEVVNRYNCRIWNSRPLAVRIREHRHNLKQGLLEKSRLAQHAYEGHRVSWDEARILEVESNSRYRKYKESAHMTCSSNPISQPSLDISPIWIPLMNEEVNKSKM
ncbi:hypothetical protein B7P43_G00740 [Cryptotermes secundus]|uniref:Uncharacterized protein n=1 Tax=Cryptotermes secundus TaxID=105785 RepID=A0A2J7Q7S3_9NEOP|nr:hypothetical protein B7P43_G00740 [Cryptotermes secundus]